MTSPLKCTKTGMAGEAENSMWITGSEGVTAISVTHIGHYIDESRYVASHRRSDWAPNMYITVVSHGCRF